MRIPFLKLPAALIPTLTSRRNAMPKVKRAILCPGSFIVVILMVNEARSCNEHARTSKRTNRIMPIMLRYALLSLRHATDVQIPFPP